ncbi:MAG: hypothetical protein AMQ22_02144 [Candidatus Methanofastidiosum methylothiophilum]|uniref:Glycosyltransferase RgtA/B/C/D-like domain-containing protein n=1 Tax=Candidatus Methanofastidiosum methylothiophilum TaxID=1705564 RepID=A0A150IN34_9EURY|nr:MAG: hypothetical protein AMQ22_02144 [Candidatus Methanofastidiosum methylthiophilus]
MVAIVKYVYISQKIVAIISFTCLTASMIIAHQNPAMGYELSIYNTTPILYWIFLIVGLVGGIGIVILQILSKNYNKNYLWLIGIVIIIYSRISILLMPYIRGYVSWQGDNISHLGLVKDIVLIGNIQSTNFYPVTHILLSQTIILTDLETRTLLNVSTLYFSILFIIFTYLLASTIFSNRGQQILAVLLAGVIFIGGAYNVFLMPNGWSIFFIPLFYYCYLRREILQYNLLFIIILIIYPFFHPLSALLLILSLVILELIKLVFTKGRIMDKFKNAPSSKYSFTPVAIGLVCFLPWVLSFHGLQLNLHLMWQQITTGIGYDAVGNIENKLNMIQIQGLELIILAGKMYGISIILSLLSFLGFTYIYRKIRNDGIKHEYINFIKIFIVFTVFLTLYILYLLGFPGTGAIAGSRIINYFIIFTPCLSTFILYKILVREKKYSSITYLACSTLIVLLSILSISILFPSPYIVQPNNQITHMDMNGMTWFINEKNMSMGCTYILSPPYRFADGILGTIQAAERKDLPKYMENVPDHFGLMNNGTDNKQLTKGYFALTEFDRTIYSTVWKQVGRFSDEDFYKIQLESSINKIYSNKGLLVYLEM